MVARRAVGRHCDRLAVRGRLVSLPRLRARADRSSRRSRLPRSARRRGARLADARRDCPRPPARARVGRRRTRSRLGARARLQRVISPSCARAAPVVGARRGSSVGEARSTRSRRTVIFAASRRRSRQSAVATSTRPTCRAAGARGSPRAMDEGELYRRLRAANPAPFAGIARLPGFSVLSSSPERLLQHRERHREHAADRRHAAARRRCARAMLSSGPSCASTRRSSAEHVMLVDLERNDLGRDLPRGQRPRRRVHDHRELRARTPHRVERARRAARRRDAGRRRSRRSFQAARSPAARRCAACSCWRNSSAEPRDAYTGSMGYLRRRR